MKKDNQVIRGLWIGKTLSNNEILCIKSYLHHGHQFELFLYYPIKKLPRGVIVRDANTIIPESEIFLYSSGNKKKSLAIFSDYFRYKMLFQMGGWWSDMDAVCMKPYDFEQDYVIMQEKQRDLTSGKIASGVIKCPPSAPVMGHCLQQTQLLIQDLQKLKWGETGPALLAHAVIKFSLDAYVVPIDYFSPISYFNIPVLFTPFQVPDETYSIHLFNEGWRSQSISKNGIYPRQSAYEMIKKKFGVTNNYLKLIPEFADNLCDNGFSHGSRIIKSKLWHMFQAFKKNIHFRRDC